MIEHGITKVCLSGVIKRNNRLINACGNHAHIDIFPLDYCYADETEMSQLLHKVSKIKKALYFKTRRLNASSWKNKIGYFAYKCLYFPFSTRKLARSFDVLTREPNNDEKNRSRIWIGGVYSFEKESHPSSMFDGVMYFPFGDLSIPVPAGYERYLADAYGDLKKLVVRKSSKAHYFIEDDLEF